MNPADFRFGFRIVGKTCEPRRLIDAGAAFAAYCDADSRCCPDRESYLSAFWFDQDFKRHLDATGSTADFGGPCWSPWLWWDIDRADLEAALKDARRLALHLDEAYRLPGEPLLVFFSGSKGLHLGLPTALWSPPPALDFNRVARRFAENVAERVGVTIDQGVYDKVRAFRAPNSRHPKTGLHKRWLTLDELLNLSLDAMVNLARQPTPFEVPTPRGTSDQAAADWQAAAAGIATEAEAVAARQAAGTGPTLNRSTLDFIRRGALPGEGKDKEPGTGRHRLLFSAAANLGEFNCPQRLAEALLEESALDAGLSPKEVRRQIECGLRRGWTGKTDQDENVPASIGNGEIGGHFEGTGAAGDKMADPPPANHQSGDLRAALAKLWNATPEGTEKAASPIGAVQPSDDRPLKALRANFPEELSAGAIQPSDDRPPPQRTRTSVLNPLPAPGPTPAVPTEAGRAAPSTLPPPLVPLPPGAVPAGKLDAPCRCGSVEYADFPISEGRTRRDCLRCRRFIGFGVWYDQGGPTA